MTDEEIDKARTLRIEEEAVEEAAFAAAAIPAGVAAAAAFPPQPAY